MTMNRPAHTTNRLSAIRRLYVYVVAFVSLVVGLTGAAALLDTLSRLWLDTSGADLAGGPGFARAVASSAGLLLVATPIFLVHWNLAQRHRAEPDERDSVLRKLFLYAATALSVSLLLVNVYWLVEGLMGLALGAPARESSILPAGWLAWTATAAINGALVLYWYRMLRADGDYGVERRGARIVRQIFLALAGLVGVAVAMWGAASALQVLLGLVVDWGSPGVGGVWWKVALSRSTAQLLIGFWLARSIWVQWADLIRDHPAEGQAVLRRVYLYVAVVMGAIATLTPAALLLREGLLIVFGSSTGPLSQLLHDVVDPLAFIPVGAVVWRWYWGVLRREADAYGESREGGMVRRLYYYLVAATGLALMWVGAVELLHAIVDVLLAGRSTVGMIWTEPLATGLSLLAVGAPIWALHWRTVQSVARRDDAAGAVERASLSRRIYLYGVALVGALIILFELAQVVYRLLLMLMGDASATLFSAETAYQLANCLVAGGFWAVHLLAIRGDAQMDKGRSTAEAPETAADADTRRAQLLARIQQLEAELAAAHTELEEFEQG